MSPLASILREEIRSRGPISFRRFMELSLTHPQYGYYRRGDPFGREGDYYTAEQLQPVYGLLMAARIEALREELGAPEDFTIVELGAGRAEMSAAFSAWRYIPVDLQQGALPQKFTGVVLANEFFDALPVEVLVRRQGSYREMLVDWRGERFVWVEGQAVDGESEEYARRYTALEHEGELAEVNLDALRWLERIAKSLERGFVVTVDYGYTRRESVRFPRGTLMSYRRHRADEDVLAEPGERDITAHVCFTALEEHGRLHGLAALRLESLAQTLMAAGERDGFAAALAGERETQPGRRRLQLKTLLFGMGQSYRTLLQKKLGAGQDQK